MKEPFSPRSGLALLACSVAVAALGIQTVTSQVWLREAGAWRIVSYDIETP